MIVAGLELLQVLYNVKFISQTVGFESPQVAYNTSKYNLNITVSTPGEFQSFLQISSYMPVSNNSSQLYKATSVFDAVVVSKALTISAPVIAYFGTPSPSLEPSVTAAPSVATSQSPTYVTLFCIIYY
jgi:hypothetical protein